MPVNIGSGVGEYTATIEHVNNGEFGNESNFRRPSIHLENRTEALKTFANSEEIRVNAISLKADTNETTITAIQAGTTPADLITHVADDTRHTVYANATETREGTIANKVVAPTVYKTVTLAYLKNMYDAVVGDLATTGVTHSKLVDALVVASSGWKILVLRSEFVDATHFINVTNLEIEFRRGATLTQGSAITCFNVDADDFYLSKARLLGFNNAINITANADRTVLRDIRYKNNTADVTDLGVATSELGQINE